MHARGLARLLLTASLASAAAHAASPVQTPIVVYRGPDTVPAAPYWQALDFAPVTSPHPVTTQPGVAPLEHSLPLQPETLQPGAPFVQHTPIPVRPFFVLGMDRRSLDWLAQSLPTLLAIKATGMVVQATHPEDWHTLENKARAAGLSLALYPDTGLTEAYGITTYPVLVLPGQVAHDPVQDSTRTKVRAATRGEFGF